MAEDGDRHVLGDPYTRQMNVTRNEPPSLTDETPARDLPEAQLRRELANLDVVVSEAPQRGIAPDLLERAERRLSELRAEAAERGWDV